jgi:choice-of-anchor B domain-containing protein
MNRFFALLLSLCTCIVIAQPAKNLTLLGQLNFPGQKLSGCWHYNDTLGNEYALVGAENGIAIVDITNPALPHLLFQLPGVISTWHEIKVLGNFAYAVSEGTDPDTITDGMQIIDLSYLPDSAPSVYYHGNGAIDGQLRKAHSITADGNYVYVNGHNITSLGRGVLILNVSNPKQPDFVGAVTNRYCHDSYVRDEYLYTSDIYDHMFSVYDITIKSNPVLLATQITPGQFTHNTWLSDNSKYLFSVDEHSQTPLASYDIQNLNNITLLDTFYNDHFTQNEVHNVRVLNDFLLCPSYGSQVTIVDAKMPDNLIEIGNYTTGSSLCWDADPYLNSGNMITTDMNDQMLYIFAPHYIRACYLTGTITDSITGLTLANVSVDLTSLAISDASDFNGYYATGYADSGTYSVSYSLSGYFTQTQTVNLTNGNLTTQDIKLIPISAGLTNIEDKNIVYPNPAKEFFYINSEETISNWKLIDAAGRIVASDEPGISGRIDISTSAFSRGFYTLEIVNQSGVNYRKVLLN